MPAEYRQQKRPAGGLRSSPDRQARNNQDRAALCLPNDTRRCLAWADHPSQIACDSRSLLLERFANPQWKEDDRRRFFLSAMKKRSADARAFLDAWLAAVKPNGRLGVPEGGFFEAKLNSRLMVNMAGGVMENAGLCLDRFSGEPYIPGSAVKGCARRMAVQDLLEAPASQKADLLRDIALTFGWGAQDWATRRPGQNQADWIERRSDFAYACGDDLWTVEFVRGVQLALCLRVFPDEPRRAETFDKRLGHFGGRARFLPAYPLEPSKFELDVVTGHHSQYYRGDEAFEDAPDTEEPVPVVFPAVGAGTPFAFAVVPGSFHDPVDCARRAIDWLKRGLQTSGIGAKTNAGYGWFRPPSRDGNALTQSSAKLRQIVVELASPAFFGGAVHDDANDVGLRAASLRGLLRWWWRTLVRDQITGDQLRGLEAAIWGDTESASALQLRVEPTGPHSPDVRKFNYKNPQKRFEPAIDFAQKHEIESRPGKQTTCGLFYLAYGMDEDVRENDKKVRRQRYYMEPGMRWTVEILVPRGTGTTVPLTLKGRSSPLFVESGLLINQAVAALSLLCRYGGVGSKARKGFGSLFWPEAWSLDDCRQTARDLVAAAGLSSAERKHAAYSWSTAIQKEVETQFDDYWTALDRLGLAVQRIAKQYRHKADKAVLGLPRQIHGPRSHPMPHQSDTSWQPPLKLGLDGPTAPPGQTRIASPTWFHLERSPQSGRFLVRAVAFPSAIAREWNISKALLSEQVATIHSLEMSSARTKSTSRAPRQGVPVPTGPRATPVVAKPSLPAPGERVRVTLMEERTKRGGWKARDEDSGVCGPIQNSQDVPTSHLAGDVVEVTVVYANEREAAFKWKH